VNLDRRAGRMVGEHDADIARVLNESPGDAPQSVQSAARAVVDWFWEHGTHDPMSAKLIADLASALDEQARAVTVHFVPAARFSQNDLAACGLVRDVVYRWTRARGSVTCGDCLASRHMRQPTDVIGGLS
jgi:hypothetical protein